MLPQTRAMRRMLGDHGRGLPVEGERQCAGVSGSGCGNLRPRLAS